MNLCTALTALGPLRPRAVHWGRSTVLIALSILISGSWAQGQSTNAARLKQMSLEQLMNLEVTSVSRREEKFSATAAALDVVTGEEIRRSGVTTIPDALRLATGMQVAQIDAQNWAVSARGFNASTANKMQVLLDGRSLYSPLFSGVFWDVQDTLLEDIDRIEVIRGPGATMWGANAVNGVINIITKSAKETQGGLLSGGLGTEERVFGAVRYGGRLGTNSYYRVYGKYFDRDGVALSTGQNYQDDWQMGRSGFRTDSELAGENLLTFQGDLYYGELGAPLLRRATVVNGGNLLGRWTHRFSPEADLQIQAYYDRTVRRISNTFREDRDTYDLDAQHHFPVGSRNQVIYGANYRLTRDEIQNSPVLAWDPTSRDLHLISGFLQDTVTLVEDRLDLTLGSKLEHNSYTGFEVQPNVRLTLTPPGRQTVWAAVSRAVRTPTRLDTDLRLFSPPGTLLVQGNRDFLSEELWAYELGYKVQPHANWSVDVATFYHDYHDLRSQEPMATGGPFILDNRLRGETYGVEISTKIQLSKWWRLSGGFTHLEKDLELYRSSLDVTGGIGEGNDAENWFTINSSMDFGKNVEFDTILRYVDRLPAPHVPSYLVLDLRLGWEPIQDLEFSLVARNLLDNQHPEFGTDTPLRPRREVEQSVYAKVTWRF